MDKQKFNLKKFFEKMKPADYVYLGVILVLFISVVIIFSISTSFFAKNINKIFSSGEKVVPQALNKELYDLAIKKLGITETNKETLPETQNIPQEEVSVTPNEISIANEQKILDKKSLNINILNSTKNKGVASVLSKALEDAGFSKATTGNEKKTYSATQIIIKEEKKDYSPFIQEVVNKLYPKAITQMSTTKTDFDVTIIIGKD